ncbi:DUF397 domain-containing protein [Streptomyces sp. WMMC905]|uniref:DUF397 domain-containing protein n=1 Tax=Streptomyces sp. WMMC905 TaxID=3404123 RepID=UPI003B930976
MTCPVQPALTWFKSSYSGAEGGQCIEVAATPDTVHVRDSKQPNGPILNVSPRAWTSLVQSTANHSA